jgi:hypothetical protein
MIQNILEKIPAKANLAAGISNPTRIERDIVILVLILN